MVREGTALPGRAASRRVPSGRVFALALFTGFFLLGVAFTYPLGYHLTDALPYAAVPNPGHELIWRAHGDYLQFYYYLWLFREGLLGRAPLLRDPYQFATGDPPWNLPGSFIPLGLLYTGLAPLGTLTAYNLLVLLSFPFSGLAMAAWLHRVTGSWLAGTVGGLVYALAPYRLGALLGGQPAGMAYPVLPLVLLGVEGALAGRWAGGLLAGASLLALALLDPHFVYFTGFLLPLYVAIRWLAPAWTPRFLAAGGLGGWGVAGLGVLLGAVAAWAWERTGLVSLGLAGTLVGAALATVVIGWQVLALLLWRISGATPEGAARQALWCLAPLALLAGVVSAPGWGPALAALSLGFVVALVGWRCAAVRPFPNPGRCLMAARPWLVLLLLAGLGVGYLATLKGTVLAESLAAGRTLHEIRLFAPRPADLLQRVNPHGNQAVYPGAVAVLLAALGAVTARRQEPGRSALLMAATGLTALAVLLSLGPSLRAFPLYEVAYRLVPFFGFMRQPAKFQVLVALGLGLLAGVGAGRLAAARGRWGRWLPALAVFGLLLDYHPGRPIGLSVLPTSGPVYQLLQRASGKVLFLPLWPGDSAWSSVYLYTTTLTRTSMLNGYSPLVSRHYVQEVARPLESLNWGELRPDQAEQLRRLGVELVVLDRGVFPPKVSPFPSALTLARLTASPWLEPVRSENPLWVFRLRASARAGAAPAAITSPQGVFYEAEWLPRQVGTVIDQAGASGGKLVAVEHGAPGFITFGPYRVLPPGRYRTVFRLAGHARVEVAVEKGTRVLTHRLVTSPPEPLGDVSLDYALSTGEAVEFRVFWPGRRPLRVDYVYTTFADQQDPAPAFEVEALAHALEERRDAGASGGVAGSTTPLAPKDAVLSGPYRRYPAGQYVAAFRLKVEPPTPQGVAWVGVREAYGRELVGREVRGEEVGAGYAEIPVPFALATPRVLEFPVIYRGGTVLSLDRISVRRAD